MLYMAEYAYIQSMRLKTREREMKGEKSNTQKKKKAAKQRYLPDITQGKCIIPVFRLDKDSGLAKITKIRRKNGRKKIFSWRQGILQG